MHLQPPESVSSQADLDLRIDAIRAEIHSVSLIRNTHYAVTAKLPSEVLAYIFECVQRIPVQPAKVSFQRVKDTNYRWIREVTHICSLWRNVAIDTPRLWCTVYLRHSQPEWAREVLRRTKYVPVDLVFSTLMQDDDEQNSTLVRAALARPDQTRRISMTLESEEPNKVLELWSELVGSSKLPLMDRISIHSRAAICTLPDNIFGDARGLPRLRVLSVLNCHFDIASPRLQSLRVLDLRATLVHTALEFKFTAIQLCKALREMRNIEIISIDSEFAENVTGESIQPFELPRLSKFTLKYANSDSGFTALDHIVAPSIRDISLALPVAHPPKGLVTSAYRFFGLQERAVQGINQRDTQRLSIVQSKLEQRWVVTHAQGDGKDKRVMALISLGADNFALDELWDAIPRGNLYGLVLTLSPGTAITPGPFVFPMALDLSDMQNLVYLQVPYNMVVDEAFLGFRRGQSHPPFPKLRRLALDCLGQKPKNKSFVWLRDWLVGRKKRKLAPMDVLAIINCPHHKESVADILKAEVKRFRITSGDGASPPTTRV